MRYLSVMILPVVLGTALACRMQGDMPRAKDVVVSEHISNQNVLAFEEDASGHIWIGTARGLNKYDSRVFHQYFNLDDKIGLPDNHVNDLLRDSAGRLWIATSGGACLITRQGEFQRVDSDNPGAYLRQVLELPDGRILFGTPNSLGLYNEETGKIDLVLGGLTMSSFTLAQDGCLWCTEFERISRINTAGFEIEKSIPSPFKVYHSCVMPDSTE